MIQSTEEKQKVAGAELVMLKGGSGKPLLILHDELGYPGWMTWNETLAHDRTLLIPLQPGFGKTPKIDWITDYRDLGRLLLTGAARVEARSNRCHRIFRGRFHRGGNAAADPAHLLEDGAGRADGHQARAGRDLTISFRSRSVPICARRSRIPPIRRSSPNSTAAR